MAAEVTEAAALAAREAEKWSFTRERQIRYTAGLAVLFAASYGPAKFDSNYASARRHHTGVGTE